MTPPKAEKPFQGGGYSYYDRPLTTPETISAERAPMDRVDLLDPDVTATVDRFWRDEQSFLDTLHQQVVQERQAS
jgi:hypothetical protein